MYGHILFLSMLYKQKKCKYRANQLDDNKSNYDLRIRPVVIFSQVVMNRSTSIFKLIFLKSVLKISSQVRVHRQQLTLLPAGCKGMDVRI